MYIWSLKTDLLSSAHPHNFSSMKNKFKKKKYLVAQLITTDAASTNVAVKTNADTAGTYAQAEQNSHVVPLW